MHVYVYMYIFIYIYISYINTRVFCAATGDTCFGWCLVAWITQPNSMQQHYNVSPCKHIMLQNQIPHCQHLLGSLIFCIEVFRGMAWLLHFSVLFICFSGCSLFLVDLQLLKDWWIIISLSIALSIGCILHFHC